MTFPADVPFDISALLRHKVFSGNDLRRFFGFVCVRTGLSDEGVLFLGVRMNLRQRQILSQKSFLVKGRQGIFAVFTASISSFFPCDNQLVEKGGEGFVPLVARNDGSPFIFLLTFEFIFFSGGFFNQPCVPTQ